MKKKSDRLAGAPGRSIVLTVDEKSSTQIENALSDATANALASTTIIVCSNCRDETGSDAHPRAGEILAAQTRDAAQGSEIRVRQVECLGN